jgi:aryl-alcohol dehydrogenase-like predicted oxidoreductase
LPELVLNWTIHQPGITSAVCGAKRPDQIRETSGASGWELTPDQLSQIEKALADRGPAQSDLPV